MARTLAKARVEEGGSMTLSDCAELPLDRIVMRKGELLQLTVAPNANHGGDSTRVEFQIRETGGAKQMWGVADLVGSLSEGNPHRGAGGAEWCFFESGEKGPVFLTDKRESIRGHSALKAWSLGDEPSVFVNTSSQEIKAWTALPAYAFFVHPGANRPVAVAWVSPIDGEVAVTGRIADAHPLNGDGVSFTLQHIPSTEHGPALVELGRRLKEKMPEVGPPPVIPVAYAVAEGPIQNAALQLRGDPEKPSAPVPRRWLSVFGGEPVPDDAGSGRSRLAEWILQQPVSARVMVNRVWLWHFGTGLVRSPNDFGARGEKPSHPELLDWLASEFIRGGYSIKNLHRLVLGTAAFQRGSALSEASILADPENTLLARFPRRRLSAEEIRDSLLAVSGHLDLTVSEEHPFPAETTWKFTQHNPFNAVYPTNKRSAFLMVQRQRRHPFLSLFDGADPNATTPMRQTTTVPTQALYFLNDPFFHSQAAALARRLTHLPDDTARVLHAYRVLFQREPTPVEQERSLSFVSNYPAAAEEKWAAHARVLLASNEFLHLD
jgi:hypothetical protein